MSGQDQAPRTVFQPNPGGRRQAGAGMGAAPPEPPPGEAAAEKRLGVNPLADAAAEILDLGAYLRNQTKAPMPVAALRARLQGQAEAFERRAKAAGAVHRDVQWARYALMATLDDAILSSKWGYDAGWANHTLVALREGEVIGGERFFRLLEETRQRLPETRDLHELLYLCLSLGFEGYYKNKRSLAELAELRASTFRNVESQRGGLTDRLSLRWKGEQTIRRGLRQLLPAWVVGALAAVLAAAMFLGVLALANRGAARAGELVVELSPRETPRIERVAVPSLPDPLPPVPPEAAQTRMASLADLLQELTDQGVISQIRSLGDSGVRIRIASINKRGEPMFKSGSAEIEPRYLEALQKIANAMRVETEGRVLVEGHTDIRPILRPKRFADNFALSGARAEAAAGVLAGALQDQMRQIESRGFGANQLATQGVTEIDHAQNRRIEIITYLKPKEE